MMELIRNNYHLIVAEDYTKLVEYCSAFLSIDRSTVYRLINEYKNTRK
jgi:predicted DNA-binding transcriptional regulator AlpA